MNKVGGREGAGRPWMEAPVTLKVEVLIPSSNCTAIFTNHIGPRSFFISVFWSELEPECLAVTAELSSGPTGRRPCDSRLHLRRFAVFLSLFDTENHSVLIHTLIVNVVKVKIKESKWKLLPLNRTNAAVGVSRDSPCRSCSRTRSRTRTRTHSSFLSAPG